MNFPPSSATRDMAVFLFGVAAISTIIATAALLIAAKVGYGADCVGRQRVMMVKAIAIGAVAAVIAAVALAAGFGYMSRVSVWRTVTPDNIQSIEVYAMPGFRLTRKEISSTRPVATITDRDMVVRFIKQLEKSVSLRRSHETFTNGYLIAIALRADSSELTDMVFVALYTQTDADGGRKVFAVQPKRDIDDLSLGVYANEGLFKLLDGFVAQETKHPQSQD